MYHFNMLLNILPQIFFENKIETDCHYSGFIKEHDKIEVLYV